MIRWLPSDIINYRGEGAQHLVIPWNFQRKRERERGERKRRRQEEEQL